jgi:hypothetical protein
VTTTIIPAALLHRPRVHGYSCDRPLMVTDVCPHGICRHWSNGPCTVNLAFLAPPEVGDDQ